MKGSTWNRDPVSVRVSGTDLSLDCEATPNRLGIWAGFGYVSFSGDEVRRLIPYLLYFADNGKVLELEEEE